jgi:hypothetical protein
MSTLTRFKLACERMTRAQLDRELRRIAHERDHLKHPKHADDLDEQETAVQECLEELDYVAARVAGI